MGKIYVINLAKDRQRYQTISAHLKQMNLPFDRVEATYGRHLSDTHIQAHTTAACRQVLCNRGVVGCALSHLGIWKQFAQGARRFSDDKDFVVIFEDDVEVTPEFVDYFRHLPEIYEYLQFDLLSFYSISSWLTFRDPIRYQQFTFYEPFFPLTTAAYAVSLKGAHKLLAHMDRQIAYHVDFQIAFENLTDPSYGVRYFCTRNLVRLNDNSHSTTLLDSYPSTLTNRVCRTLDLKVVHWYLNTPVMTVSMKHPVSLYILLLFLLLMYVVSKGRSGGVFSIVLIVFILVEMTLHFRG